MLDILSCYECGDRSGCITAGGDQGWLVAAAQLNTGIMVIWVIEGGDQEWHVAADLIFLFRSFALELWAPERNCLAIYSWPSTIANFWGDWRLTTIPHIKANQWDYVVIAIIWVVWHERSQRIFKAKSSSIWKLGGRISSLVSLWQVHFPLYKCRKLP